MFLAAFLTGLIFLPDWIRALLFGLVAGGASGFMTGSPRRGAGVGCVGGILAVTLASELLAPYNPPPIPPPSWWPIALASILAATGSIGGALGGMVWIRFEVIPRCGLASRSMAGLRRMRGGKGEECLAMPGWCQDKAREAGWRRIVCRARGQPVSRVHCDVDQQTWR